MKSIFHIDLTALEYTHEVNWDELPESSKEYVIHYGLKKSLNDAMASAKTQAEREAAWQTRWDKILKGLMTTGRSVSPLEKAVRNILVESGKTAKYAKEKSGLIVAGKGNEAAKAILTEAQCRVEGATFDLDDLDLD